MEKQKNLEKYADLKKLIRLTIKRKNKSIKEKRKLLYDRLKLILILKIIFIIAYILFIILFKNSKILDKNNIINNDNRTSGNNLYDKTFPKISLDNKRTASLSEIFNSRILYIPDSILTGDYIRYIRPLKEENNLIYNKKYSEKDTFITSNDFKRRDNQIIYTDYFKLCFEEKLLDSNKIEYDNKPIISIIVTTYNKEKMLLKSIRSIQNQSFKNIEIIIVNDASTDNSDKIFKYLLETDPRIRIFNHLKNMGCWRSRLNGILYSRGKYVILFDIDDFYEDNYVLEDAYNIMEKYNLDSSKFLFRIIHGYDRISASRLFFNVTGQSKIIYGPENIINFNTKIFSFWGNVWNRLTRANIMIKAIYLLNDYVLNLYKNVWDDVWWNTIISKASFSYLIYERIGYIYNQDGKGQGSPKFITDEQKDKNLKEYLGFLYFRYNMLPKNDTKTVIVDKLKEYDAHNIDPKLSNLRTKFEVLYNLIKILNEDPYVSADNKVFLNKILNEAKEREKNINNNK